MLRFDTDIIPGMQGIYIVGGSLRDLLIGRPFSDYDIAVLENPEQIAGHIAVKTGGRLVRLGKPGQIIYRVVAGKQVYDIAAINGGCIEDDLRQRDFTINAMAYCMSTGGIIDCLHGLDDLKAGCIRMVSPRSFNKDPLRLLRAYRLEATLTDFAIEPDTESAIQQHSHLITTTAGERIRDEYFKIIGIPDSLALIRRMDSSNLLSHIFPELAELKKCAQGRYHQYDVFTHSLTAYHHLEKMLNGADPQLPDFLVRYIDHMDSRKKLLLKHAILLHDIGKPLTRSTDKKGDIHFYRHDRTGADSAKNINRRLKLSTRDSAFVDCIIRNHLRPLHLFHAYTHHCLTPEGIIRFFTAFTKYVPDILLHFIADTKGKGDMAAHQSIMFSSFLLERYQFDFTPLKSAPPLLNGDDLIHELGLSPSPLFKPLLARVEEQRLLKRIATKTAALEYIRHLLRDIDRQQETSPIQTHT